MGIHDIRRRKSEYTRMKNQGTPEEKSVTRNEDTVKTSKGGGSGMRKIQEVSKTRSGQKTKHSSRKLGQESKAPSDVLKTKSDRGVDTTSSHAPNTQNIY
jgi:hypothetical protein